MSAGAIGLMSPTSERIMAEHSQASPKAADRTGESGLEREADHIDKLMKPGSDSTKPQSNEDLEKRGAELRVEQDNRVARVKAEAKEAGKGEEEPKEGINPNG